MAKRIRSLRCPTCKKLVLRGDPEFPFCSDRCRLIDLGKWASGGYVISSPINGADASGEADYTLDRGRVTGKNPRHDSDDDRH